MMIAEPVQELSFCVCPHWKSAESSFLIWCYVTHRVVLSCLRNCLVRDPSEKLHCWDLVDSGVPVTFLATEIRQKDHSELVKLSISISHRIISEYHPIIEVFALSPIALIVPHLP